MCLFYVIPTGALTLLEFKLKCQDGSVKELLLWIGYCAFHLGNFSRAEHAYKELLDTHDVIPEVHLFLACCYFYQQMYEDADREVIKGVLIYMYVCMYLCTYRICDSCHIIIVSIVPSTGPNGLLKNRILFNLAHRLGVSICISTRTL